MFIKGKPSILQKLVFELRYRSGFTYLDKCGRTLNAIMRFQPEWVPSNQPNPESTNLVSINSGCRFSFSYSSLIFSLEKPIGGDSLAQNEVRGFIEQVEFVSQIVIDQLGLDDFSRIGFRVWYLFNCRSKEEAEQWLQDLGFYSITEQTNEAFPGTLEATNFTAIIVGADRKFRIALNGVENQAQMDIGQEILNVRASSLSKDQKKVLQQQEKVKHRMLVNPSYAAMIDVDAFQEEPLSVDPKDFITTSLTQIKSGLSQVK
jgi:hypothetical protein